VEKDIKVIYFTNLSGTAGFEMLFAFFIIAIAIVVLLIYTGMTCLVTVRESAEMLGSYYFSEADKFLVEYQGEDLLTIQVLTGMFFYICGAVSLLISLLLILILTRAINIGETQYNNRLPAFFYSFNNVILPALAFTYLFFALLASDQVSDFPIIGEEYMPKLAINSFIVMALILVFLSVVGFAAVYQENRTVLEAYVVVMSLTTLMMTIYSVIMLVNSNSFYKYYLQNWGDLLLFVHQDSFTTDQMNCYGGKYFQNLNSTNLYDLKCSAKEDIALLWEEDISKQVVDQLYKYACLNQGCKNVFGTWISMKLNYLALAGFGQSLICLVLIYIAYNIWNKVSHGQERILWHHTLTEILFLVATGVVLLGGVLICVLGRPQAPLFFPYAQEYPQTMQLAEVNQESNVLSRSLINNNQQWFTVYGLQISEDESKCEPECNALLYNVTLSTELG